MKRLMSWMLSALDGEFLLRWMPNSGGVVVARSAWLSCILLFAYAAIVALLKPGTSLDFCGECLRSFLVENLKLGGAIFAACYAALYTRFASQWLYLAGLYNQIMAAQVREGSAVDGVRAEKLALWKAGFIEDAVAVHLAEKPIYAAVTVGMLEDPQVKAAYVASTIAGESGVAVLDAKLRDVLGPEAVSRLAGLRAPSEQLAGGQPHGAS